jgi:hypothetical protein
LLVSLIKVRTQRTKRGFIPLTGLNALGTGMALGEKLDIRPQGDGFCHFRCRRITDVGRGGKTMLAGERKLTSSRIGHPGFQISGLKKLTFVESCRRSDRPLKKIIA